MDDGDELVDKCKLWQMLGMALVCFVPTTVVLFWGGIAGGGGSGIIVWAVIFLVILLFAVGWFACEYSRHYTRKRRTIHAQPADEGFDEDTPV
jgi:uncharacterized membrane protein YdjX (TVP38/TMEM64 family)